MNIVLLLLWSEKICKTKTIIGAAEDEEVPNLICGEAMRMVSYTWIFSSYLNLVRFSGRDRGIQSQWRRDKWVSKVWSQQ